MTPFSVTPAEERGWMGWPQVGWIRPDFEVPSTGIVRQFALGAPLFWRQENAWTAPVLITHAEYDEWVREHPLIRGNKGTLQHEQHQ